MKVIVILLGILALGSGLGALALAEEAPTPERLVAASIAYHDPNGFWDRGELRLSIRTTYSDAYAAKAGTKESNSELVLAPGQEIFRYTKTTGDDVIEYGLSGEAGSVTVNGEADISDEDRDRLRIGDPKLYRDYFEYLYGMPMKLRDPGTNLDPSVAATQFEGRDSWALRVTYDAEVGEDIWYFYFDPGTFSLVGYRFFHEEAKNDGEVIGFEGEVLDEASGMRLPRMRAWHYNADHGYLATDEIISLSTRTP